MIEQIPAVVTPLDEHMGLDIARSLGRQGIKVFGIDSDSNAPGKYSKYCRFIKCPDLHEGNGVAYIQFLIDFGKMLGQKAVLFPLSDHHVLLCSRERASLQEYYEFVMPDHDTIVNLSTKDGLYKIAQQFNIPAPLTVTVNNEREVESIAKEINYPVILKPTESTYWHTPKITNILRKGLLASRAKIIECKSYDELLDTYRLIADIDDRLVVQEVIPGEDSRLVYISFYLNRQSNPLGIFAGRKWRIIPIGFGSASYVRSLYDPELEKVAMHLLSSSNYKGLGGIEFKKDPRDDKYKLIEFNARFGMWDGLGAKCGVDLAYIAYCDIIKLPVKPNLSYREQVIWVDWQRDARAAIEYMQIGKLTFRDWLRSLKGEKMWAIYSKEDWRPGAAFTLTLIINLWARLRSNKSK